MNKTFRIFGIIVIVLSIIEFMYIAGINLFLSILSTAFTIVLGLAFIVIGRLMDRVEFLERHLNVSFEGNISSNKKLPQKICPICGNKHDFDYYKCPNCHYEYDK